MVTSDGILSLVGNTPLVKLNRYLPHSTLQLYAKLELLNPGGSIKDRPAVKMLMNALNTGEIDENSTIIESSSGNLGIGLAQACTYLDLRFICVTDARCTSVNRRIMKAYGVTLVVVEEPDPEVGTFLAARIKKVRQLLETIPNSFNCNQYENRLNPESHYTTIGEIFEALDGRVEYLFCATSTCGTLRGSAEFIAQNNLDTKVIAVDAKGSVIFGDTPRPRLVPGHGAGVTPPHYSSGLEDAHILVSDLDCIVGCRRLMRREAIFSGGSSGAIMSAVEKMQADLPPGSNCVVILADRGGRYLDTIYNDEWVQTHFGDVQHLWESTTEAHAAFPFPML